MTMLFMPRRLNITRYNLEFDTALLTSPERVHSSCYFASQDPCYAFRDGVLNFVLAYHTTDAISQPFDFETFGDATHELDGIDGGADFFEQTADEVRFVHGVFQQVVPEVGVILFFCEGYGKADIGELLDDEIQRTFGLASL
jgi:hypothetical protein